MRRLTGAFFGVLAQGVSLRMMLLAMVLVLTVPPLLLEAVLLYRYAATELARVEVELEEDAKGAANLIDVKFAAAEAVLRVLAASPLLAAGDLVAYENLLRSVGRELGKPIALIESDGSS